MTSKPILFINDFMGDHELDSGKPIAGPAAGIMRGILQQAGIAESECHFTNVLNFKPRNGRYESVCGGKTEGIPNYRPIAPGKYLKAQYAPELERLYAEVDRVNPNVIVALGNLPLWAMCKKTGIKKYRGSPLLSFDGQRKVIPAWGPSSIMRQWELRVITLADVCKAKVESAFPELIRPSHRIYLDPDIRDIRDFYDEFLLPSPFVSCDIETKAKAITEVGFSNASGSHAIVIPFLDRRQPDGNYWRSFSEERSAWRWVRRILREKPTIGQNFSYDMQYFWRVMRMPTRQFLGDTMLLHHALQPEMEKGLGFLASIYTNEPSWKFMRTDHSLLKKGDD